MKKEAKAMKGKPMKIGKKTGGKSAISAKAPALKGAKPKAAKKSILKIKF